jgi:hypothetical protein
MSARMIGWIVATIVVSWTWRAIAEPLSVTDVAAPAINCVFNRSCTVTVTDSVGAIPIPGISGSAKLQSRTFAATAGAPAAGMTGYEFRVDLTQAIGAAAKICVTGVKLGSGPLSELAYPGGIGPGHVFAVSHGGLGTVGVASADRADGALRISFFSPICAGASAGQGGSSYFFGFASLKAPRAITAQVVLDSGQNVDVPARAPAP